MYPFSFHLAGVLPFPTSLLATVPVDNLQFKDLFNYFTYLATVPVDTLCYAAIWATCSLKIYSIYLYLYLLATVSLLCAYLGNDLRLIGHAH